MPLYEYKCHSCGDVFEIIQKFSDAPLAVHETCGGIVERLISTSALQFKGSGWYVTDYGKGNNKQKADSSNGDGKVDSAKGSESSGKSDAPGKSESSAKSETSTKAEPSSKAPAPSPSKSDSK